MNEWVSVSFRDLDTHTTNYSPNYQEAAHLIKLLLGTEFNYLKKNKKHWKVKTLNEYFHTEDETMRSGWKEGIPFI